MGKSHGHTASVLVVDDEQAIRQLLAKLLEKEGYVVGTADSVAMARVRLAERSYDVAMVDKNLLDGSGMELARHIAEVDPNCAVVIITAYGSTESAIEAIRLQVSDYLEKPFGSLDKVRHCLRRVLELRSLRLKNVQLVDRLQTMNDALQAAAVRDSLTSLYNHAFLQESLQREFTRSKRHDLDFALLLLDVDDFKQVNDTFGHPAGDMLLRSFSALLEGGSRQSDLSFRVSGRDVAARYGGDEFALLLPETTKAGAAAKAQHLCELMRDNDFQQLGLPPQTVSVGIACFPVDADHHRGIVEAADLSLYVAKRSGKNRAVSYSPSLLGQGASPRALPAAEALRVQALEETISQQSVDYVYQPIVEAESGRVIALEALCRPRSKQFRGPAELIETAERAGRVTGLGRVLRTRAVSVLSELPEELLLFVNLHPQELHDPTLVAVDPALEPLASRLVLEVTESSEIRDYNRLRTLMERLRDRGFRFALDDLGSGYAGLNSLALLQPEFVKLDMSLVHGIARDRRTERLVKHLLEFAEGEGMQVVAEGVETDEQRRIVTDLGCNLLQGYLFSRGVPPVELAGVLQAPALAVVR